ncbi:response regulator [Cohnella zeiphila]|uniref:Response regulator n=1 Tax=Cohnella zeiphila TaxID=2761120 RepID=A0A7X0SLK1_9BACL|nr:response regulator [Cohnella zeiphila]MBB6730935.1 response regulator [Cohnella zeiphila]
MRMLRLLIVDDEILVRIGLKTIIPMGGDEFEIVGEVASGVEALEVLERTPCDIVLTDIRMPDMDGLELLEHIHERWPDTKTFILSNHSDFAYVQKALRLGAAEYIVKLEIEPEELMRKLRSVRDKLIDEREKRREATQLASKANRYGSEVREKRLRELLLAPATKRETDEWLNEFDVPPFPSGLNVILAQIEQYDRLLADNRFQSERLLQFTVGNVLTELLKKYGRSELATLDDGRFAILYESADFSMLDEMRHAAHAFLQLTLVFGVSRPQHSLYLLHGAYEEARVAIEHLFYAKPGERISLRADVPDYDDAVSEPWDETRMERLIEAYDEPGIRELVAEWTDDVMKRRHIRPAAMRQMWIRLTDVFSRSLKAEGTDIYAVPLYDGRYPHHAILQAEKLAEIYGWFVGWIPLFLTFKRERNRQKWRSEVQTVVRLIADRLHLPLKVSELAAEVGFTENYLSILFKKETGETITDMITRMRMKKARDLLKDPEIKIYEVSEQVGYSDPNHFSRSFKQLEGMYPTEFRKLALGKS